jgi:hypothetical protein
MGVVRFALGYPHTFYVVAALPAGSVLFPTRHLDPQPLHGHAIVVGRGSSRCVAGGGLVRRGPVDTAVNALFEIRRRAPDHRQHFTWVIQGRAVSYPFTAGWPLAYPRSQLAVYAGDPSRPVRQGR